MILQDICEMANKKTSVIPLPLHPSWEGGGAPPSEIKEVRGKVLDALGPANILDSLEEGVIAIGLDKKVLYLNRAAREMLGLSQGEVFGMDCQKAMRSSVCSARCLIEKTIESGEPYRNYEISLTDRHRRTRLVRVNTALLKDADGHVVGGVEIFHDVTQLAELKKELKGRYAFGKIIGQSEKMRELFDLLPVVAQSKSTVLIEGESGTGKELIAHAIHENSPRKDGPFIKVNCAALSEGVLESELFGHVRGAFTGAVSSKPGRFELASGGTLFLDEIGEISASMQVKLLRVLQEEEFERVGGTKTLKVDVRVIAATNRDLKAAIDAGTFRRDLYYRLRVVPLFKKTHKRLSFWMLVSTSRAFPESIASRAMDTPSGSVRACPATINPGAAPARTQSRRGCRSPARTPRIRAAFFMRSPPRAASRDEGERPKSEARSSLHTFRPLDR
jgi:PAS domain S-box